MKCFYIAYAIESSIELNLNSSMVNIVSQVLNELYGGIGGTVKETNIWDAFHFFLS